MKCLDRVARLEALVQELRDEKALIVQENALLRGLNAAQYTALEHIDQRLNAIHIQLSDSLEEAQKYVAIKKDQPQSEGHQVLHFPSDAQPGAGGRPGDPGGLERGGREETPGPVEPGR